MATDFNSAPAAVKTTVLKYGSAESIIEFEEDVDDNDLPIYVVTLQKENTYTYLTVSKAGKLISKEVEEMTDDEGDDEASDDDDSEYED